MPLISQSENINNIMLKIQGSAPATPAAGLVRIYQKSDGFYFVDDSGVEHGPLEAGMLAAIYDPDEDGKVLAADEADALSVITAEGDLAQGGADGITERLAIGAEGQILKVVSGKAAWEVESAGFSNPMTARGDLIRGTTDGVAERLALGVDGYKLASDGTDAVWDVDYASLTFVIDGGGTAITTGIKGDLEIPFTCVIERATLLADQSGDIVIDLWKDSYANYPPTVADTITAAAKPTLSSADKSQDSTLSGWTTTCAAGDILRINVDSAAIVTRVTLSLRVRKT